MKEFTLEELKKYDGQDGRPAYVAYDGVVYDVSDSTMWDDGDHMGAHSAGEDLTKAHDEAPHDAHILDYPKVGTLI
ncbi:MAG TPA: cytochrome B5 [Coriobacteriia bacterium]|nr:MAG: Cytochrome b5-domain protein [Actinobacteria bacterium 66_15]HAL29766.1 cytochrome B5 [Coriobacteriia bacterium]